MKRKIKLELNDLFPDEWSKEQKEYNCRKFLNLSDKYDILWEGNKLIGIKPLTAMERVDFTITLD